MRLPAFLLSSSLLICAAGSDVHAAPLLKTLRTEGGAPVLIWRNSKAQITGLALLKSWNWNINANPALLAQFASCVVDSGTLALVTNIGVASSEILIVDGPEEGCDGIVENERFEHDHRD